MSLSISNKVQQPLNLGAFASNLAAVKKSLQPNSPETQGAFKGPGTPQAAATQQAQDVSKFFPGLGKPPTPQPIAQSQPAQVPVNTPSTSQSSSTTPTSSGTPGYWQRAIGSQLGVGQGIGNPQATQSGSFLQDQTTQAPAQQSIQGLQSIAGNQTPAVTQAQQQYNQFARQSPLLLSDVKNNPNVAAEVSVGRGQALGQTLSQEQTALAQNVQNALAGQGQQIQAGNEAGTLGLNTQAQQISAANQAGALGLSDQSQRLDALNNVAGATAPVQVPYGTQYGTPEQIIAGQNTGSGGALNPLNNVQSIAQQVVSNQISPSQAYSMGGSIQNWQGVLNQAIQQIKPGFNTANAEGQYSANQQNTTTSGTTPTNAASSVYQDTYKQLLDLQNTTSNVDQFSNLLLSSMKSPDGSQINPTDAKFANKTLAEIKGQLSDQQQAVFDNTYASLKSRVSGLLAMGGSEIPTQITADANKILDGSLPLKSLSAVLSRISTEGNILQGNLQNKLNTAGSVIGAPKSNSGTGNIESLRAKYGY